MRATALVCATLCAMSCKNPSGPADSRDYRQDMRDLVTGLSRWARDQHQSFSVVIQNGHEILKHGESTGAEPARDLIAAIDGVARESLYFGYPDADRPTEADATADMLALARLAREQGLTVLVTDYCGSRARVDASYARNAAEGFISFAAHRRELDGIPPYPQEPYRRHGHPVTTLEEARNFLYLINPGAYDDRSAYLEALAGTAFDLLILDLFYGQTPLTQKELARLQRKPDGARRLVIAYMSIGEAEDYRYYFRPEWLVEPPTWLRAENPDWEGNYKVAYWEPGWQELVYGSPDTYLGRILAAGFDGVYLDIIDGFEYFEAQGDRSPPQ